MHRIVVFHRFKLRNKQLTDPVCAKISSSKEDLMRIGVMNVLLLLNQRERMREIVVIGRDYGKARRETDIRKYGQKKYCRTWLSCEDP